MKRNLNSDGYHFHQNHQNEQSPLISTELIEHKKDNEYYVGNPGSCYLSASEIWSGEKGFIRVQLVNLAMSKGILQYIFLLRIILVFSFPHEVFGDTKKLLTQEFVRQGYLEYTKQPNSDPPMYDFRWGQRAKFEISKRSCLNFVSQVRIIKTLNCLTS